MKKSPLALTRTAQLLSLLAATAVALQQNALATPDTWTGASTPDTNWETAGNWSTIPGVVPGTGEIATFSTSANTTVTSLAPVNIGGIFFDPAASNYTLNAQHTLDNGGFLTVLNGNQAVPFSNVTAGGSAFYNSTAGVIAPIGAGPGITATGGLTLGVTANGPAAGTTTVVFDGTGVTTTAAAQIATIPNTATSQTQIVKNGPGVLVLGASGNTNIWGGFQVNAGTVIANNATAMSNRGFTIGGGATLQMNSSNAASFNQAAGNIVVQGNARFHYNSTGNWGLGQTTTGAANTSQFSSVGNPTATFSVTTANQNGIRISANNGNFNGTYKLGQNGALTFNAAARGSSGATLDMGDAGFGSHYFSTGVALHDPAVAGLPIQPIKFGALTGADPAAVMSGRQNVGSGTTGTQFEIGALNTSTLYAGNIRDGSTAGLLLQNNGTAAAANQTATATHAASAYARGSGAAGVQGTTELVKVGTNTLTLTGTNSHSGGTVIKGGTIAVSSDAALGATYDGSLRPFQMTHAATGGVVYLATDLPDIVLTGGNPSTAASANVYGVTLAAAWNQNNMFLSFSSQANDVVAGAITNTATGSGYISVPAVSLTGGTVSAAGTAPNISVRVNGLLTLDGGTLQTNAGITSNRAIVIGAGGGTIKTQGFDSTFSGNINGAGNLTLNGGGTVNFTAPANALTGVTTVGANTTLNLAGSLAGTVTVNATGHLKGNGSATGATINGEISPGNSIGQLTFSGSTALAGVTTIEIDPGAATADFINVTAGSIALAGDLNVSLLSPEAVGTFNIIDAPSFSGAFANVNLPILSGGLTWDTSLLNSQGILSIVPEPGSVALAALGLGVLARRRRQRLS